MKKVYKQIFMVGSALVLTLTTKASVYNVNGKEIITAEFAPELLEGLKIKLAQPNVSGALVIDTDDTKDMYYEIVGNAIVLYLSGLKAGKSRLTVSMQHGTSVVVLFVADLFIPANASSEVSTDSADIFAVATMGDGSGVQITVDQTIVEGSENPVAGGAVFTGLVEKADGTVYRVGESGDHAVEDIAKVAAHSVELCMSAQALGYHSVAFGSQDQQTQQKTIASGDHSFAHGHVCVASATDAHAEGYKCTASGSYSHAEGSETTASGVASHSEGKSCVSSGDRSHAEGENCRSTSREAHAEGLNTEARGAQSHSEGWLTLAKGSHSHAEGVGTIANTNQHVTGMYNIEDANEDYALIVGNGSEGARSNAFAIDWNGNLVLFNNGTPVVLTPAKLATLIA